MAVAVWLFLVGRRAPSRGCTAAGTSLVAVAATVAMAAALVPGGPLRPRSPRRAAALVRAGVLRAVPVALAGLRLADARAHGSRRLAALRRPVRGERRLRRRCRARSSSARCRAPRLRFPVPASCAGVAAASVAIVALAIGGLPARHRRRSPPAAGPTVPVGYVPPSGRASIDGTRHARRGGRTSTAAPAAPLRRGARRHPGVAVVGDSTGWSWPSAVHPARGWRCPGRRDPRVRPRPGRPRHRRRTGVVPSGSCPVHRGREPVARGRRPAATPDVIVLGLGAWEVFDRELPDGTRLRVGTASGGTVRRPGWTTRSVGLAVGGARRQVGRCPTSPASTSRDLALGGPPSRDDPAAWRRRERGRPTSSPRPTPSGCLGADDDWLCAGGEPRRRSTALALRPDGVQYPRRSRSAWT